MVERPQLIVRYPSSGKEVDVTALLDVLAESIAAALDLASHTATLRKGIEQPPVSQAPVQEGTSDQYLTFDEAAELLKISVKTLRRICDRKEIRYRRVGSLVRFRPEWIRDYVERLD
jgi:excisionase family DNA binding protein